MALKKSQLYSSLWQSCDELRGGMDASQYKDYILTLLFMKYVSDKPDTLIDVPAGGSFADMVQLKGDKEIGDKINIIIGLLAEANDLKGVIDQADFNDETKLGSGKAMQDRLSRLVAIFNDLDFRANRTEGDDLLGDAYEYLMRHFATESGKSKGQFYTPAEVSRVMAQVVGVSTDTRPDQTIYDPTCGSGSLLLKAADEAPYGISVYGVYLIATDGWTEAARPRGIIEDKEKKIKETPDLTIKRKKYKMDLIPLVLIVSRYFATEQTALETLQAVQDSAARALEEFVEEQTGEDGLLADAATDKGTVTRASVKDRLKTIQNELESDEEQKALKRCLALIEAESNAGKAVKDAQAELDQKVLDHYAVLTEAEIKTLVVEDKWFASIRAALDSEVQRLTQQLAGRVKELEERYAQPLPELEREVEEFSAKVEGHLKKMGLSL